LSFFKKPSIIGYVTPFALRKDVEGRKNVNNETRANIPDEFDGVYFDPGVRNEIIVFFVNL